MCTIRPEYCEFYHSLLQDIRYFFKKQNFLEVETPLLNQSGNVEAYIDSFHVFRKNAHKSPQKKKEEKLAGYLITSPEYKLKSILASLRRDLYQIAHCFRSGDIGDFHLEEFLMLEWYKINADEFALMKQCEDLLHSIKISSFPNNSKKPVKQTLSFSKRSLYAILQEYVGCGWERENLEQTLIAKHLPGYRDARQMPYSDLFFTVFLNLVEHHLGKDGPEFIYHYPPELSAFSKVENGYARRFELYWNGLELANGYYELTKREEYEQRFFEENTLRKRLKKETMVPDRDFCDTLENNQGLPECSGIALGVDRLFLLLLGEKNLKAIYKYE